LLKRLGAVFILAYVFVIAILAASGVRTIVGTPFIVFALNAILVPIASFTVAYLSAKSFLSDGSLPLLYLGSGVLAFGLVSLVSSWTVYFPGEMNVSVTVYCVGAFVASILHLVSGFQALSGINVVIRYKKLSVAVFYSAVMGLVALITVRAIQGALPIFFIEGFGLMPAQRMVIGIAIGIFMVASFIFMKLYQESKCHIQYWYALALAVVAVGLFAVFIARNPGEPLALSGETAQYIAGIYFLVAAYAAISGSKKKMRRLKMRTRRVL